MCLLAARDVGDNVALSRPSFEYFHLGVGQGGGGGARPKVPLVAAVQWLEYASQVAARSAADHGFS